MQQHSSDFTAVLITELSFEEPVLTIDSNNFVFMTVTK